MPWVPAVIAGASAIYGAVQNKKAGGAAKGVGNLNAAYEVAQAEQTALEQSEQIKRTRMSDRLFRGSQRAAIANAGVVGTTGSPLDAQAQAAMLQELHVQDLERSRDAELKASKERAKVIRAGGNAQASAYRGQAFQSLISGAANVASYYAK
jgi:hypothetical protein